MSTEGFLPEKELDVVQLFGAGGLPELIHPSLVNQLIKKVGCTAGEFHVENKSVPMDKFKFFFNEYDLKTWIPISKHFDSILA